MSLQKPSATKKNKTTQAITLSAISPSPSFFLIILYQNFFILSMILFSFWENFYYLFGKCFSEETTTTTALVFIAIILNKN